MKNKIWFPAIANFWLYKKINSDLFLRNNLIYFIGSLSVSALNYLYYPVIGRVTTIATFGEVQSIISITLQIGIILGVFGTAITNIVANSSEENEKIDVVIYLQWIAIYTTVILFFLIIVSSIWLKNFLQFSSFMPFIALAFVTVFSVPYIVRSSYLQGKHDFVSLSIAGLLYSSSKIIFSGILLYIGFKTFGAISGIALAQALGLLFVYLKTKDHIQKKQVSKKKQEKYARDIKNQIKKEIGYLVFILLIYITISILYTSDVLIVKHFFSPKQAGLYASISTTARIIYFLTGSVGAVLIPSVKVNAPAIENLKTLGKGFIILLVLGGGTCFVFTFMPSLVIRIIMGTKFLPYASYLPSLSIFIFLASCVSLLFTYLIALRKFYASIIAIISLVLLAIIVSLSHSTVHEVILSFSIVNFVTCILLFVFIVYNAGIGNIVWKELIHFS